MFLLLTHQTQPQQQHQQQQQNSQITSKPATQEDNHNLSVSSAMPPHSTVDHSAIIKGKRTKRPRSTSPASSKPPPLPHYDDDDYNYNYNCNTSILSASSPATSSAAEIYESTEEEEDMANCLIMLAQGNGNRFESQGIKENDGVAIHAKNGRKFSEIATTNRAGFFVYECKTCNRSFPSFQALGGHRASHKKPKTVAGEEKINKPVVRETIYVHGEETEIGSAPTDLALQISSTVNNKAKVHECSICGAEFSSGQALGGHMRRHRAPMMGNQAAFSAETNVDSSNGTDDMIKQRNVLSLDLNLPAPEDDHHLHSSPKFQFGASPPSTALVFSTPALVDCHY